MNTRYNLENWIRFFILGEGGISNSKSSRSWVRTQAEMQLETRGDGTSGVMEEGVSFGSTLME